MMLAMAMLRAAWRSASPARCAASPPRAPSTAPSGASTASVIEREHASRRRSRYAAPRWALSRRSIDAVGRGAEARSIEEERDDAQLGRHCDAPPH
jgi:hypothetical protein